MAKAASGYGQIRFPLWPKEGRLCPKESFGVISMVFVRHFNAVLASISLRNGVNTDGCPVQASKLVTGRIYLATGGLLPVHIGNRTLAGADLDLPCTRKPSAPCGVCTPPETMKSCPSSAAMAEHGAAVDAGRAWNGAPFKQHFSRLDLRAGERLPKDVRRHHAGKPWRVR